MGILLHPLASKCLKAIVPNNTSNEERAESSPCRPCPWHVLGSLRSEVEMEPSSLVVRVPAAGIWIEDYAWEAAAIENIVRTAPDPYEHLKRPDTRKGKSVS